MDVDVATRKEAMRTLILMPERLSVTAGPLIKDLRIVGPRVLDALQSWGQAEPARVTGAQLGSHPRPHTSIGSKLLLVMF